MKKISVLILTKNEAHNIDRSVGGVFEQNISPSFEVIVVDSGSSDGTLEKLEKYPVRLIQIPPENFHHARTRNFIAEESIGELLVYLAGDALPASNRWLSTLVEPLQDPQVAGVYGRHLPKENASIERRIALAQLYSSERMVKNLKTRGGQGFGFYQFSSVNCALRRSIWQKYRFPDELRVFEDVGIAKRILDEGGTLVYEPGAAVYHSHDYSATKLFKRFFDTGVIWKELGIDDGETLSSIRAAGMRGMVKKIVNIRKEGGSVFDLARSLTRDFAKGAGFFTGRRERFLPLYVKRRFSAFGIFGSN